MNAPIVADMASPAAAEHRGPWTPEELVSRLQAVGDRRYHDKHPFHVRMHAGQLTPAELRRWVLNRFAYQQAIPVKDALILSKLPREERRFWLTRIIDHDGARSGEGGIELWVRLGAAVGLPPELLWNGKQTLPGVRFAVDAYVNFCRDRPWLEAVASSMTELFAPSLLSYRIEVIEQRYAWVDPDGLEYFRRRLTQQPKDVRHVLGLVCAHATTAATQDRVIAALEFKCEVLWAMLDAIAAAPGDPLEGET